MVIEERKTLAWHETLEIHELVAAQSNGLMKLKMSISKIKDHELKNVYKKTIEDMELNVKELLPFYPAAPIYDNREEVRQKDAGFYAGDLLGFCKATVRNYAIAITETATPTLRKTFIKQLLRAIECHARIFNYMYKKGLYPAYHLDQLLSNDLKNAKKALSMKYK